MIDARAILDVGRRVVARAIDQKTTWKPGGALAEVWFDVLRGAWATSPGGCYEERTDCIESETRNRTEDRLLDTTKTILLLAVSQSRDSRCQPHVIVCIGTF